MKTEKTKEVNTLGERLKFLREKAGLTQAEVAETLNISDSVLSRYENEHTEPPVWLVGTMCEFYHVSTDYVISGEIDSRPNIIDLTGISPDKAEALKTIADGLRQGCCICNQT